MLKDYIAYNDEHHNEDTFVEEYWTQVWVNEGGPKGKIEHIGRQEEYKIMSPHLKKMPEKARILDGGSGLGDWVLYLQSQNFDAIGIDISRRTVDQLTERFPDAGFVVGDIRDTNFDTDSFDAYFSWGVFEHFESGPQDCIKEALRVLKPGGMLFMSVPQDNVRQSLRSVFGKPKAHQDNERFYQYRFTRAELARELTMGGFELESFHPIHKRQGVLRSLHHEFGLPYHWLFTRALSFALAPFVPGSWFAHMVLAVARKPL